MEGAIELNTLNNFFSELKDINIRLNNLKFHELDEGLDSSYQRACNCVDYLLYKYEQKLNQFHETTHI